MDKFPKHITAIVGAGAVLDFKYDYPNAFIPSTKNITDAIKDLEVLGLNSKNCDVISQVYNLLSNRKSQVYANKDTHQRYESYFEELYYLLESMLSLTESGIDYYDPNGVPTLATLISVKEELKDYKHVEYERALSCIIRTIIDIIDKYDTHFREHTDSEKWYRSFWKGMDSVKYDVFTFNYDTTIEQSIGEYEDGFELIENNTNKISAFKPRKLLQNIHDLSTIQHLHGCIYYAEYPEECGYTHSNRDFFKMNSVKDALRCLGRQQDALTQANESYKNSPIIIGLRKLDKMTFMPSSIYHANLVNKLVENSGLLIVGYSFGDLYVNQLLLRRLLMNGVNHRMVIIDYLPPYVNSVESLYRYLYDENGRMLQFIMPFFKVRIEDFKIRGLDFTSYNAPIYSEDHNCMLLICGFKKAVELHSILSSIFYKKEPYSVKFVKKQNFSDF